MTTKVVPGLLIATPDADEAMREGAMRAARIMSAGLASAETILVALSASFVPMDLYRALANDARVDWRRTRVAIADTPLPPTGDVCELTSMLERAGATLAVPQRDDDAESYGRRVAALGRTTSSGTLAFDMVLVGVGTDGTIAGLRPADDPLIDSPAAFAGAADARVRRITITPRAIEHARAVVVSAIGRQNRDALERAWLTHGDVHATPARAVRGTRGSITWVIDKAAGGLA